MTDTSTAAATAAVKISVTGPDSPAFESACYSRQMPEWEIVNDCFKGHTAIKAKGSTYLPKHQAEIEDDYAYRATFATYWEGYERAVNGVVGLVFKTDPVLGSDVPPEIKLHAEDIDLDGTHFDVFAKETFKWAANDGHAGILIDIPPKTIANPTKADDKATGRRPYWVRFRKNQIINCQYRTVAGKKTLTQLTLKSCVTIPEGDYGEREVTEYLALRIGSWRRWQELTPGVLSLAGNGDTGLNFIPFVVMYTHRTGFMESKPRMLGIARQTLKHYRLGADLEYNLHFSAVPILVEKVGEASGATLGSQSLDPTVQTGPPDREPERRIAAGVLWRTTKGGDIVELQRSGQASAELRAEMTECRSLVESLGMSMLTQQPKVQKTATQSTIDAISDTSEVSNMARAAKDALEQCLLFHAKYLGESQGGSIELTTDFRETLATPAGATA